MQRSLIDSIYDSYLHKSGKGQQYDVPIVIVDNGVENEVNIRVWAKNAKQAEERAVAKAHTIQYYKNRDIQDKSLGLMLPRQHYKPKSVKGAIFSPFAVWRDPVYKKAWSNIFGAVGYKPGTMTKLSINELSQQNEKANDENDLTQDYLTKALKVNVVSIFIWIGLLFLGAVFLALGLNPDSKSKFVLSMINPYIVASAVCWLVGSLALYKTIKDYKWITKKLAQVDSVNVSGEASNDG